MSTSANALADALGGEDSFRVLVDSVKDYAIILLDQTGHVVSWNPGAAIIKGYRPDEILGKHFSCFYPADAVRRGFPNQELEVAAAQGRFEDEGLRVRKNGEEFWASVVITALRNKDGTLRGFGKLTRDLTERKQTEEQLQRQSRDILELSTPVMEVWRGIVVAPLIGSLDSVRAKQFTERLLKHIVETKSRIALVDITGVPAIDIPTAEHLVAAVGAVRLIGSRVMLTGVQPLIAQMLVDLGIDLSHITTHSSLASGLQAALNSLNLQVVSIARSESTTGKRAPAAVRARAAGGPLSR